MKQDEAYMALALREARKAFKQDEVPVGAVIVHQGKIIGRGYNRVEQKQDVSYHAEMIALRQAARRLKSWRLEQCRLFVTLEPCAMCAGAIVWSRIEQVVYAASDSKAGACGSVVRVLGNKKLNHSPKVVSGILASEAALLLKRFFKNLRQKTKKKIKRRDVRVV
ncbi:tRNA adenosine(34) deaminase TadA [bacterium]|nr:tRNA adenosine(34) deaminase TadA [bacterium]